MIHLKVLKLEALTRLAKSKILFNLRGFVAKGNKMGKVVKVIVSKIGKGENTPNHNTNNSIQDKAGKAFKITENIFTISSPFKRNTRKEIKRRRDILKSNPIRA